MWSQQLGLYLGIDRGLLRWFTANGKLVSTLEETTAQAQETAAQEQQKAAQAQERVESLAAKLRELNIDPDTI